VIYTSELLYITFYSLLSILQHYLLALTKVEGVGYFLLINSSRGTFFKGIKVNSPVTLTEDLGKYLVRDLELFKS
jgi:hypothetical protein